MEELSVFNVYGREVKVDGNVIMYFKIISDFDSMQEQLLKLFSKSIISHPNNEADIDADTNALRAKMISFVKTVVDLLCKQGIYDYSADNITKANPAFDQLKSLRDTATEGAIKIIGKHAQMFYNQWQDAQQSALSGVTGTGTRVFTNSPTTLLLFSAYENSVLQRQLSKADSDFKRSMDAICLNCNTAMDREINRYLAANWCPAVGDCIQLFVLSLMDTYLNALKQKGVVDTASLANIDAQRSQAILENIDKTKDAKDALAQALALCPYNKEVYKCMADRSILDADALALAEEFGFRQEIEDYAVQHCEKDINGRKALGDKIRAIRERMPSLILITGLSESEIIRKFMHSNIVGITKELEKSTQLCADEKKLLAWCKDQFEVKAECIVDISGEQVEKKSVGYIGALVSYDDFCLLESTGLRADLYSILPSLTPEVQPQIAYNLIVMHYAGKLSEAIDRLKNKIRSMEETIRSLEEENAERVRNINSRIKEFNNKMDSLGIFAVSEKRKIKTEIAELDAERINIDEASGLWRKKNEYRRLSKILD